MHRNLIKNQQWVGTGSGGEKRLTVSGRRQDTVRFDSDPNLSLLKFIRCAGPPGSLRIRDILAGRPVN